MRNRVHHGRHRDHLGHRHQGPGRQRRCQRTLRHPTADRERRPGQPGSAVANGPSAHQSLTETAGPAATVGVTLTPSSIVADGKATSQATATVTDAAGNLVTTDTVSFSTDGDVTFGPVANNGDGTYATTITASKTADHELITAEAVTTHQSGTATQPTTERPAPSLIVSLCPSAVP